MPDLAELELSVSSKRAVSAINRAKRQMIGFGDTSTRAGMQGTAAMNKVGAAASKMRLLIAGVAGAMAFRAGIRTIASFGQEMSGVQALTQATAEEMDNMQKLARELGSTTKFTAAEAAKGMQFMAMAGLETNQILAAMPGTLDLAAAGMIDLGAAADIATNILAGFGLQAKEMGRVGDVLALTSASANTNVFELGEAMKFSAPIASNLGVEIEEVSAAIGTLSNAGIKGGEAGTVLRRVMLSLIKPSTEAKKALATYGFAMEDLDPQVHGFTNVLQRLADAQISVTDAAKVFEVRGVTGFLALQKAVPEMRKLTDELTKAEGAAKRMAEARMDNLIGDWLKLKSAISEVAISLGEDGAGGSMRDLLQSVTKGVRWLIDNWNHLRNAAVMTMLDIEDFADVLSTALQNGFDTALAHIKAGWFDLKGVLFTIFAALEEQFGKMIASQISKMQFLVSKASVVARALPGGGAIADRLDAAGGSLGAVKAGLLAPSSARGAADSAFARAAQIQAESEARNAARISAVGERSFERTKASQLAQSGESDLKAKQDALDKLKDALDEVQAKEDERNIFDRMGESLDSLVLGFDTALDRFGDFNQRVSDMGEGIAYSIDANMTDALVSFIDGTKSAGEAFRDFANAMVADLIRIMVQQLIVRSLMTAFGGGGGAPVMHSGGVVGAGGPTRQVGASAFAGANRFSGGGIAGDEVPIVAHRGEGVFTKDQMAALGQAVSGGDRSQPVEIINVADPSMVDERIAANPDAVLNVINRNRQSIRRTLGIGS